MTLSVNTADVRRKSMVSDTSYDSMISALISETVPVIEYTIADKHLASNDVNLKATLNLGALEIVTGDFIEQLIRDVGYKEGFTMPGITLEESKVSGADLIQQGWNRLTPYLKDSAESEGLRCITDAEDDFTFAGSNW